MHSTSSQCSSIGRPKTKAAMKGYENLKVSIPTTGLDLQQALDRSPNSNGCKLAALADIALGTDAPSAGETYRSKYLNATLNDIKASAEPVIMKMEEKPPVKLEPTACKEMSKAAEYKSKCHTAELTPGKKKPKSTPKKSTGNKLGFKERKKKQPPASKTTSKKAKPKVSNLPKDVYDFEESADSIEGEIKPLTHTRLNKSEPKLDSSIDEEKLKKEDEIEDESSYSDRDGFFNYNSVDGTGSDEEDESEAETVVTRKDSKTPINVQKKCLIMGRIFKNAKKNPEPPKREKKETKKAVPKPLPRKQINDMFDTLRQRESLPEAEAEKTKDRKDTSKAQTDDRQDSAGEENSKAARPSGRCKKSREITSLEAEWGMPIEEIKGLMGVGGKRKTQRRCTTNKQKKCVETWSSDEYEEFHSTKDIIALIQEAEIKAQRTKNKVMKSGILSAENSAEVKPPVEEVATQETSTEKKAVEVKKPPARKMSDPKPETNKENNKKTKSTAKKVTTFSGVRSEESDFESDWNRTVKRAKIKNRRRTIAFREDVYEEDEKVTTKVRAAKDSESEPKKAPKAAPAISQVAVTTAPAGKPIAAPAVTSTTKSKQGKSMPRRKRIASEMLYYWSSSSDEEFGRIKPNENEEDDNHLEQHGWIVGDSHKKLVTLLAHAKGKKIDDCAVKEAIHKKK